MANFLDLPLELLPYIIEHVVRPSHLANICLVSKSFQLFAVERLYRRAFIYSWHKNAKTKVVKLFRTLATCPHLAKFVESLTIRDFPRALLMGQRDEVLQICLQGIRNCVNLRACTWTRDGSLSTEILQALQDLPILSELEINGHNQGQYRADILVDFINLRKIALIMPSAPVVEILPSWTFASASTLRHLNIICKASTLINDDLLEELAPNLVNLEQLHIVGCPRVSHRGLWAVIASNALGILGLGIEGLYPMFDMAAFSQRCQESNVLKRLRSITLTVYTETNLPQWTDEVVKMLSQSPLEMFHISTVGGETGRELSDTFCSNIVAAHGKTLCRFSVHRMKMSMAAVEMICRQCVNLEQLFVVLEQAHLGALCKNNLGPCLAWTRKLRALHVNRPLELFTDEAPVVPQEQILSILRQSSSELHQIGFNTRVWQVRRDVHVQENGDKTVELQLSPYEHPEIPEQFLVVRT